MLHEQQGAGGEALNHERTEHDGSDDVTGHAEGEQGDQRTATHRVVGGFGGGNAFKTALAVLFRGLGETLGF